MSKLLLIGIDSLEPAVLEKLGPQLPNFTRLRQSNPAVKMTSVFPVDSLPAWITIYTGVNPAKHGIVYSFDIFESSLRDILSIDASIFKGKTFWDRVSMSGKKVCALFPMMVYPPWAVNGAMVTKTLAERRVKDAPEWVTERETMAFPSWVMEKYQIPQFMRGVYGKHPGKKNLPRWGEDAKRALVEEAELALKIGRDFDPDLMFVSLSWLDIIQHRVWRFFDSADPTYPGDNPYGDIIKEAYQLLDQIVGKFFAQYPGVPTMIFSDHGHGIRPARVVNINKLLRQKGFLFSRGGLYPYLLEWARNALLGSVNRLELDYWLVKLSTGTKALSSMSKGIYMSTANLDMTRTVAYLSSFAGVKSYSHGGIEIERRNLKDKDYEGVRESIIRDLLSLSSAQSGSLVEWARCREDLYQGDLVAKAYPDIVFHLKEGYGTGWGIRGPLMGAAYDHNLAPGGHKKNAVLLLSNINRELRTKEATLMDLAPTILELSGLSAEGPFDGRSLFR